jgi:hypothetical protein
MRVVKYFCYEVPFLKRDYLFIVFGFLSLIVSFKGIFDIRENEIRGIRKIQHSQSAK